MPEFYVYADFKLKIYKRVPYFSISNFQHTMNSIILFFSILFCLIKIIHAREEITVTAQVTEDYIIYNIQTIVDLSSGGDSNGLIFDASFVNADSTNGFNGTASIDGNEIDLDFTSNSNRVSGSYYPSEDVGGYLTILLNVPYQPNVTVNMVGSIVPNGKGYSFSKAVDTTPISFVGEPGGDFMPFFLVIPPALQPIDDLFIELTGEQFYTGDVKVTSGGSNLRDITIISHHGYGVYNANLTIFSTETVTNYNEPVIFSIDSYPDDNISRYDLTFCGQVTLMELKEKFHKHYTYQKH